MTVLHRPTNVVWKGAIASAVLSLTSVGASQIARADDNALIKRGEYLATAGDCVACHSAPGGEKFAGGLYMDTPFGKISTPNITPDKDTGIGNWSDDQFYRAMHEGIDDQGAYLYPVFPFPWYTKVTKDDALAIKAYLFSLKPVHAPRKPIEIGFPFNIRSGLAAWRALFFKADTFQPDPKASAELNRGAYLVEGLGHCGECHNKEKLFGASDWSGKLEGGQIESYYAPNLTADGHKSAGLWSKEEIVTYLKTGSKPDHTSVAEGPMKETITDSLSHMNDADLGAIATYLKSVGASQAKEAGASKGEPTPVDTTNAYLSHCASCHQTDGKGIAGAIPPLAGNGAVTAGGPQDVIEAVLGGLPASHGLAPMPALGQTMSDADIAAAVSYVRKSWGNNASADVGAGEVGKIRDKALTMLAANRPHACIPVKDAAEPNTKVPDAINDTVKGKLEKMDRADMLTTIKAILPGIKSAAPKANTDQITNGLTAAYCPIVLDKYKGGDRSIALGTFATLVYGEAKDSGKEAKNDGKSN